MSKEFTQSCTQVQDRRYNESNKNATAATNIT